VLGQALDALVLPGEHDLLVTRRDHLLVHHELEQQVERTLLHFESVELAFHRLEWKCLVDVLLVRPFGNEDAGGLQHVGRNALVEPALTAHALPFEIPREIRVRVGVRVLEVNVDGVVEGLAGRHR
jgi:hypothetical protein